MVDKELRSSFGPLKILSFLLSRTWGINLINFSLNFFKGKNIKGLSCEERFIPSKNGGPDIRIRIFKPLNINGKLPAMLYCHGGGYVAMNPEFSLGVIKKFIETRPCVIIAPDYRKALRTPFPAGFNDCFDTLLWAKENADTLGIHSSNFIVAGHSAGGGLTTAITWKARDTQVVNIAFQMPIYPMIDDRQITDSAKDIHVPVWNTKTNSLAWNSYLKEVKGEDIPKYAAAARNTDYKNFPPTITFVGEFEPFRDENIEYVEALKKEGIPVEFKFYKGCFHGFDILVAGSSIAKDALGFTYQSYAKYYDTYIS
ncbi:MAG: alpha/beta hydrolase [Bacteroidia bacterium]|nr:MAG: alpha/beta hydrolase [Bacteroidia bacterium]